jgi:hypothetical protein
MRYLLSFYYYKDLNHKLKHDIGDYKQLIKNNDILIDSGAFTFLNKYSTIEKSMITNYIDRYIKFINDYNINLFVELDLDNVIGKEETKQIRKQIETETNKLPIWVLQEGRNKKDLDEALEKYNYIAIPFSGRTPYSRYMRNNNSYIMNLLEYCRNKNENIKIHLLGYTPNINDPYIYIVNSSDSTKHTRIYKKLNVICEQADETDISKDKKKIKNKKMNWKKLEDYKITILRKYSEYIFKKYNYKYYITL